MILMCIWQGAIQTGCRDCLDGVSSAFVFLLRGTKLNIVRCQDSSMVKFLRIGPMVSCSSPTAAKLSLRVRRVASSLSFQT